MAYRPLMRDDNGALILPGSVKRVLTQPFGIAGDTALPSWLTNTAGTVAVGEAGLTLTTAVSTSAAVQTVGTFDSTKYEAVLLEFEGVSADANVNQIILFMNTGSGAVSGAYSVIQASTPGGTTNATFVKQNTAGGGTANQINTPFPIANSPWGVKKYNLGLLALPRYGHVYTLMGDQVLADVDYSASFVKGAVKLGITGAPITGAATVLTVEQMRITICGF